MPFLEDRQLATEAGRTFGEYIATFTSATNQVRADFFRRGQVVSAYVSFPSGLDARRVTDPYVGEIQSFARERGFADQFRVIYS